MRFFDHKAPILGVIAVVGGLGLAQLSRSSVASLSDVIAVVDLEHTNAFPKEPALFRTMVLGGGGFVASILWTSCIFSYADQILTGKSDVTYAEKLNAVIDLDTLWQYPYEFAGLTLDGDHRGPHPVGLKILALGVQRFPLDGRMAILLSQEILRANWIDSAKRIDSARLVLLPLMSSKVNAPEYARTIALTMTSNIYGDRQALRQLFYVWGSEHDALVQYSFSKKLPSLLAGATSLDGDSLVVVERGINLVMQSKEPGIGQKLDSLIDDLNNPERRALAFRLFWRIQES